MLLEFTYFITCFLIPRIGSQWKDESAYKNWKTIIGVVLIEIVLLLPFMKGPSIFLLLGFVFFFHLLSFLGSKIIKNIHLQRILEFGFLLVVGGFFVGYFSNKISFNTAILECISSVFSQHALLQNAYAMDFEKAIVTLFGVVVLINELNAIVRYVLGLLKTEPMAGNETVDNKELSRGKIIGVIERIFFFFFVLTNNYGSIAFILAAKAFTRFRELDNKNFAEYVLIGTLLSSSLSIFWAYFISKLLL